MGLRIKIQSDKKEGVPVVSQRRRKAQRSKTYLSYPCGHACLSGGNSEKCCQCRGAKGD